MAVDWVNIGETGGAFVVSIVTYMRGRATGHAKERQAIVDELADCHRDKRELRVRLSALETEMVTLRKLLPGGEWFTKLGLHDDPYHHRGRD